MNGNLSCLFVELSVETEERRTEDMAENSDVAIIKLPIEKIQEFPTGTPLRERRYQSLVGCR
jgi:hypothetical protein